MIKLENWQVLGWDPAIRGMRNPMNSWEKSDSVFYDGDKYHDILGNTEDLVDSCYLNGVEIGQADRNLMMKLANGGSVHAKYRRMIAVYVDITAPLYWWKEFDTYKVGTVANSCSTMHKIQSKPFEISDFSTEHLFTSEDRDENENYMYRAQITRSHVEYGEEIMDDILTPEDVMYELIEILEKCRVSFLCTNDKKYWWQMIQLLPSSYNQKRTVMMNYEVLSNIYASRKDHKLDEWRELCAWIETLPESEIITGKRATPEECDEKVTYEKVYNDFLKEYPDLANDVTDYRPAKGAYQILVYTKNNGLLLYDWKRKTCRINVMDSWMQD